MILQVTIGLLVGRSFPSRRSIAFVVVIVVWGSSPILKAPSKSIDDAGMDLPFVWLGGSRPVSSERNGSRSSSGSFSK